MIVNIQILPEKKTIRNYRTISLMNIDTKTFTKILAKGI